MTFPTGRTLTHAVKLHGGHWALVRWNAEEGTWRIVHTARASSAERATDSYEWLTDPNMPVMSLPYPEPGLLRKAGRRALQAVSRGMSARAAARAYQRASG